MIKIILIAITVLQTVRTQEILSSLEFDSFTNEFDQTFECYLSQKVIKGSLLMGLFISETYYFWVDSRNLTDPKKVFEMYPQQVHVLVTTTTRIDHSLYGELTALALKDQPIKALWIPVSPLTIQSCDELKGFLKDLRNAVGPGPIIGIYTEQEQWSYTFNKKEGGCPQVPLEHPLFYETYYFDEIFTPFAGWKQAEYIMTSQVNVTGCQVFGDENSVLYFTKP